MKKLLYICCGVLCLGVFITSCSFRNTTPSVKSYFISSGPVTASRADQGKPLSPLTLKLLPIRGPVPFRTARIYYQDASFTLNSYVFSRWATTPAAMLQMKLVRSLEAAALFRAVLPSTARARADFLLDTTLYDFSHHIIRPGDSSGVITAEFRIVDTLSKKVVSSFSTTIRKTTPTPDAPGAVVALNNAAETLGKELVHWLEGVVKTLPERDSR
ncbi:MAG: hypothetical protein GWP10_14550 [Nitrospiraceae bacterium]|nr:hypothetical protein [Nitrospiraceae bacterium]